MRMDGRRSEWSYRVFRFCVKSPAPAKRESRGINPRDAASRLLPAARLGRGARVVPRRRRPGARPASGVVALPDDAPGAEVPFDLRFRDRDAERRGERRAERIEPRERPSRAATLSERRGDGLPRSVRGDRERVTRPVLRVDDGVGETADVVRRETVLLSDGLSDRPGRDVDGVAVRGVLRGDAVGDDVDGERRAANRIGLRSSYRNRPPSAGFSGRVSGRALRPVAAFAGDA